VVISYRRFGTTYRSHLQWSRTDGIDRFFPRDVGKKLTTTRCVITHKSTVLFYFPAETSNHAANDLIIQKLKGDAKAQR